MGLNASDMDFSHRRKNILTGEWIQVSPHRTKRPWQGKVENVQLVQEAVYESRCYLCPGNTRAGGHQNPAYEGVFVFDNDFAALQMNAPNQALNQDDLLLAKSEKGICRVVCFSEKHNLSLAQLDLIDIQNLVQTWRSQYEELGAMSYINYVQIFENKGEIMGCSNPHPHGQIWAQESLPQEVVKEQKQQEAYWDKNGRSLLLDYVALEIQKQERVLFENDLFVVLVPFWAVWPFETMIAPKIQCHSLSDLDEIGVKAFAEAIQWISQTYDLLFNCSFPYSSGIHQAPTDGLDHMSWQMHMHFYPPLLRSASVKKFMVGYEMMGNPQRDFTPEYAAKTLRELRSGK